MPEKSELCGQYTVYWLLERYRNFDLDFMEFCCTLEFVKDLNKNDTFIKEYIEIERE